MTDRFDPKLHEEIKQFAIRLAARAEEFKKLVMRANDHELTATSFDNLLDAVQDTKDALEEELGEGAFDVEDDGEDEDVVEGEIDDDNPSGELPPDSSDLEEEEEGESAEASEEDS